MSISLKYFFPGFIVAIFFLTSAFLVSGLIYFFYNNAVNQLVQDKTALLQVVQRSIYDPMFYYRTFGAFPKLKQIVIAEASKSPGVVFLRIVEPATSKIIFSGKDEKEAGEIGENLPIFPVQPFVREGIWNNQPLKEISIQGIAGEGLWMGVDLKSIQQAALRIAGQAAFLIISVMIISYAFLYFILRRIFMLPFGEIVNAIYQFGRGKLDTRISPESRILKEIGELGNALNKMMEDLKKSHTALEEAKTALEIKVEARTKELREFAEGLEEEVKRRTKEVQERMKELERFQRLAVGRELKMIELKEKITKLEKENKKLKTKLGLKT